MKTKKSIWSIALILVLALAMVLGLGFGASRAVVKADPIEDIEHITFDVTVENEESIVIGRNYNGYIVVRYTVAENTGVDALQLQLGYDHDVFALTRLEVLNNTALGAATVTNGTLDENNVVENYDSYIYDDDIDANIVFDNTNTNGTTYTETDDVLIVAYFARIATTPGVYNFGFADANNKDNYNKYYDFSNAWRIEKSEEETSTHAHVELRERVATVYIRGDYEFTLTDGGKTYDGTAGTVTLNDNDNAHRPEISYVWFVDRGNGGYEKLNAAPVSAGTYKVVIEYAANDYYDAYVGYTETTEGSGLYNLDSNSDHVATFTIAVRVISIKINDQTSVYGEAIVDPLTYVITSGEVLEGDVLGVVISTDATSSSDVGTYSISGMHNNSNYSVVFTNGTYTITKKSITITALDQSASYTGSEPIVDQNAYSVDPNIQIAGVVITKQAGVTPGTYVLTPSFNNGNYNVTTVNGTFTITVTALTQEEVDALVGDITFLVSARQYPFSTYLTMVDKAASCERVYDSNMVYVYAERKATDVRVKFSNQYDYKVGDTNYTRINMGNGDAADYAVTDAGVYVVKMRFLPGEGYAFADGVDAEYTVTLTITRKPLTIKATSNSVQYNDNAPAIIVDNGTGWAYGLTPTMDITGYDDYAKYNTSAEALKAYAGLNYVKGQNAGTKFNVIWNENAEEAIETILYNYDVTLEGAEYDVTKKVVNASDYTFDGYTGVYDGAEHALAVGSAENINANFDIVNINIIDKSSVKDVADTGAYTATITLKNPNNYTFENGNNGGWLVDEDGYVEAERTAQVTITAKQLTINIDYTKTTATFTLTGFVGDDTVADLTNLAYTANQGQSYCINGNVFTVDNEVNNIVTISATSENTNYTIANNQLRKIIIVGYLAGAYDVNISGAMPVLPSNDVFFAGFTTVQPQPVALNHYTFKCFSTDSAGNNPFDYSHVVNESTAIYVTWEENEKYTLTLYYMVEGDVHTLTKIAELQFYSDSPVNYNELPVVAQKAWFKVQKWFNEEALETKFVDGSLLAGDKSIFANYKFNIGLGDVNANGKVNANDVTLYRQWIVGGYTMQVVENGKEWETVNSQEFDAENTIYFVKRVADSNALTAESLELGDNYLDIRDVSTIRMGMVGGYGFSIMEGKFVDGEELIVTRTVSADNASDLLILAKSGVAVQLADDITEEDFVGAIENAAKDIVIDLNGHTITVKSLRISLAANNTGKIEIKNGRINVADGNGVHLSAPAGSIVLDNVTLYDRDGEFNLQAADHSLHFYNVVKFLKYNAQDEQQPLAAEVKIEKDTHVVVEEQAVVTVEKIVVTENFVKATSEDAEITVTIRNDEQQNPIVIDGNHTNEITTLNDLLLAAQKGGEYALAADLSYTGTIRFAEDTVIDLNGHTLRSVNNIALAAVEGAKLTINGNGNVYAQEACVMAFDGSEVEINGGTFTAYDNFVVGTNGSPNRGNNTITINGGVFNGNIQTTGYVACGIYVANNDTVVVNGGTFNITNGAGIVARAGNTTVGSNAQFNVTGNGTGKVGDSRVVVPAGEVLVVDLAAGYPGYDEETFAFVNNTNYRVVAIVNNDRQILKAADFADEAILMADIDYSTTYTVRNARDNDEAHVVDLKDMTLNLNGHTIYSINGTVVFGGNGATIKNGTFDLVEKNTDGSYKDGSYALFVDNQLLNHYGSVTLEDVVCDGGINLSHANVTLNNVSAHTTSLKFYTIWAENDAVVTINSGNYVDEQTKGKGIISTDNTCENLKVYVNGGNFTGVNKLVYAYKAGAIEITGGTFNIDPTTFVAEGYYAEENNGVYTVKAGVSEAIGGGEGPIGGDSGLED